MSNTLETYCREVAQRAKRASKQLSKVTALTKNRWLQESADRLESASETVLAANHRDLDAAANLGLSKAATDRLRLSEQRICDIANGLRQVALLPDPIGEVIEGFVRPNGLEIRKVRVPLGTVFFIYESRPNVTADAAAICVKSGNSVVLRGGKEAFHSSKAIVTLLCETAECVGLPDASVQLVELADRGAVDHFLALPQFIDVTIPRGGKSLIERVCEQAKMPVIKHYDGNCHIYVDCDADLKTAVDIVINSKCQRMGVCNALESLLIHAEAAARVLPAIAEQLFAHGVEIRGDAATCEMLSDACPASDEDWATEYLGPVVSCKIVHSLEEALEHIERYGSHHTDAIITSNLAAAQAFMSGVDSSAVMVNASTRFNDGSEFGMGAEIGISTDKFHARGPCGLRELTSYKYLVVGSGQTRT